MALKSDDNLITLVFDTMTAIDILIAIEYELAMRCKSGQEMTARLEKARDSLRRRLDFL